MRWIHGVAAVCGVIAIGGLALLMGGHRWAAALFFGAPLLWLVVGNAVRCPVCRKHVLDNGRGYVAPWIETPKTCVGCGRRKDDIWPFQWLVRPEKSEPTG